MSDLVKDLCTLTSVGKYNMDNLLNKSMSIISHNVEESIRDNSNITSIDIGLGVLHIQHTEDTLKYKFVPSNKLDTIISNTVKNRESKLVVEIDTALGERINNTFKDLF